MKKTTTVFALVIAVAVTAFLIPAVTGQDDDDDASSEAAAALSKAIETGKSLFHDEGLGTKAKACAACHEDPKKPKMHLAARVGDYPKWDRREKRVITLGTKVNQMIDRMLKGEKLELGGEKLVAIEAWLMSISRDR